MEAPWKQLNGTWLVRAGEGVLRLPAPQRYSYHPRWGLPLSSFYYVVRIPRPWSQRCVVLPACTAYLGKAVQLLLTIPTLNFRWNCGVILVQVDASGRHGGSLLTWATSACHHHRA